jgi:hypothetical protein
MCVVIYATIIVTYSGGYNQMKSKMWLLHVWIKKYNKIWNIEIDVCAMFKVKYELNIMHSTTSTH